LDFAFFQSVDSESFTTLSGKYCPMKIPIGLFALFLSVSGFAQSLPDPIVFVSRRINSAGSDFYPTGKDMAGVGAYSRFRPASPGSLLILAPNGQIRTLVNGASPTAASLNLIDVNAPDVSWDGSKIVFAGLPNGTYSNGPRAHPGEWRIYIINVDGSGLTKLTHNDLILDYSQFGTTAGNRFQNAGYDDGDPAWLPDGRIVFSSTRWPVVGQYSAVAATNLYVMNSDGSGQHRITAERNGADRSTIDPTTGKIVYSRWWRNFRFPLNDEQLLIPFSGSFCDCVTANGITAKRDTQMSGSIFFGDYMNRNGWQIAEINPDGTGLRMFAGDPIRGREAAEDANHGYGGTFAPDGTYYANFFPMRNMTEAAGFGGIRRYRRGPGSYTPVIGVTTRNDSQMITSTSFAVQTGNYAGEPLVLPDGRLLISWAQDTQQQYGLYLINADGTGRTLVYDGATTSELRAKLVRARPVPPIIPDSVSLNAALLPPTSSPPYDIDGTYQFAALNVYGNAPVDWSIPSAIPVGSAARIKFFLDHQRTSHGSLGDLDFPILLNEQAISPGGRVVVDAPANLQLFEQIRGNVPGMPIPFFGPPYPGTNPANYYGLPGAAHVAGLNFGRPGQVQRCIGCHAGHSMIPVPSDAEAEWSNLAPGVMIQVSSGSANSLIDRKSSTWWSVSSGAFAKLTFPVPVRVRAVKLWGTGSQATVTLFADSAETEQVGSASGTSAAGGGDVSFSDQIARMVRIDMTSSEGLQEVEINASGNVDGAPLPPPPPAACADGRDNDADGLIDLSDPGCASSSDNDETNAPSPTPPPALCADGLDNDGDGLVDFPADPGCTDGADNDEFNVSPPPTVPAMASLSISPSRVLSGHFSRGSLSLTGPAPTGGVTVTLTSSLPSIASVPSFIRVEQGLNGQSFQVATNANPPSGDTSYSVTITATANGSSKSVALTVTSLESASRWLRNPLVATISTSPTMWLRFDAIGLGTTLMLTESKFAGPTRRLRLSTQPLQVAGVRRMPRAFN
jgi:WD40-like Beta Propeller Repeat